jgi:hypothetical protein
VKQKRGTELGIFSFSEKIEECREKWKEHFQRMDETRIPKQVIAHKVYDKRHVGRQRKRWEES